MDAIADWVDKHLVELSSLFVAGASFFVSWLTYSRDCGRLDLYIGFGEILDGATLEIDAAALHVKIVNSGRRPITAVGIYGNCKWQLFFRIVQKLLTYRTPDCLRPTNFWITNREITAAMMPGGRYRALNEGESIEVVVTGQEGINLGRYIASKAANVYVSDSLGRQHYIRRAVFNKIKYDASGYPA